MFRRSLTPRSKSFLHRNSFVKNPLADNSADVVKSGRCLRCYDNQHQADNCKIYRLPTPEPCRLFHNLFHKSVDCHNLSLDGKPRKLSNACQAVNNVDNVQVETFDPEQFSDPEFYSHISIVYQTYECFVNNIAFVDTTIQSQSLSVVSPVQAANFPLK